MGIGATNCIGIDVTDTGVIIDSGSFFFDKDFISFNQTPLVCAGESVIVPSSFWSAQFFGD